MTTSPETDVEDFVVAYLTAQGVLPGGQIAGRMGDRLDPPFILVQRVAGDDDFIVDYPTVSIHSFASTQTAASDIARAVHHAMRQMHPKTVVTMPDSSMVNSYGVAKTEQTPIFVEWEPGGGGAVMSRYVARYRINLRLPTVQL